MKKTCFTILSLLILVMGFSLAGTAYAADQTPPPRPEKYNVPFFAPQNYIDHEVYFKDEMVKIGNHPIYDFNTPNGGIGNIIVIEGKESLVILDTCTGADHARIVEERLREITKKPVEAIIYTHHHADHVNGAIAFTTAEDAANGKVKIIAAENFMTEVVAENQVTGPIMGLRAGYMFGALLPKDGEGKHYHIGCCGYTVMGEYGMIEPNTLIPIEGITELVLAGEKFLFFYTGGEAGSHLAVYMPERKVLFTGDEIQGPTFPQLHSLRGTKPRDIIRWVRAVDRMRDYDVEYLVPSHAYPISGRKEVSKILTEYRDRMQYVHDQSVRLINAGYTPDELAETVSLPEALKTEPYGVEYYGQVHVSVRNIYGGYISWWNGDPAGLNPTPRKEKARRMVTMMGGRDKVFNEAEKAFFADDPQWAAELTTYLVRINKQDWDARYLKAAALRKLGYQEISSSARGFYLTGALELEGKIDTAKMLAELNGVLFDAEKVSTPLVFENLKYRINPERAASKHIVLGYEFIDTKEKFSLELRNSILEIRRELPQEYDAMLTLTRKFANKILRKEETTDSGIKSGDIKVKGDAAKVNEFYSVIDRPGELPAPDLVLR